MHSEQLLQGNKKNLQRILKESNYKDWQLHLSLQAFPPLINELIVMFMVTALIYILVIVYFHNYLESIWISSRLRPLLLYIYPFSIWSTIPIFTTSYNPRSTVSSRCPIFPYSLLQPQFPYPSSLPPSSASPLISHRYPSPMPLPSLPPPLTINTLSSLTLPTTLSFLPPHFTYHLAMPSSKTHLPYPHLPCHPFRGDLAIFCRGKLF